MSLPTLDQARTHCRADPADTSVQFYLDAAILAASQFLNRQLYDTPALLADAVLEVPSELTLAQDAYGLAVEAANALEGQARCAAMEAACNGLRAARYQADTIYQGMVSNAQVNAAILLTTGHLFRNREDVTSEAVNQLPQGAHALLWPYRVGLGV